MKIRQKIYLNVKTHYENENTKKLANFQSSKTSIDFKQKMDLDFN